MATYTIRKNGLTHLKVAGQLPGMQNQFRMGVTASKPQLRDILNKAIQTITDEERDAIVSKHLAVASPPLIKSNIIFLIAILTGLLLLVIFWRSIEVKKYKSRLKNISQTDALTGMHNRMMIYDIFEDEVENAFRFHRELTIMIIDIDHFKQINNSFGHQKGDKVLRSITQILLDTLRQSDKVGRWGDEEFLAVCPDTNIDQALWIADRLRKNVRQSTLAKELNITISVGVGVLQPDESHSSLLKRTDSALTTANHLGPDETCVADAPN